MKIISAEKNQAAEIASLIMEAMNFDCCRNLAGPNHDLKDFYRMMTELVAREDSQYSYRNTLVAMSDNDFETESGETLHGRGLLMGACVSYDGGELLSLRNAFIELSMTELGMDHSKMPEETKAGELYIDTLCVNAEFRHHGIATRLLEATIAKASQYHLTKVGLLCDKDNTKAEELYTRLGFKYIDDNEFGGHPMKHLQIQL